MIDVNVFQRSDKIDVTVRRIKGNSTVIAEFRKDEIGGPSVSFFMNSLADLDGLCDRLGKAIQSVIEQDAEKTVDPEDDPFK